MVLTRVSLFFPLWGCPPSPGPFHESSTVWPSPVPPQGTEGSFYPRTDLSAGLLSVTRPPAETPPLTHSDVTPAPGGSCSQRALPSAPKARQLPGTYPASASELRSRPGLLLPGPLFHIVAPALGLPPRLPSCRKHCMERRGLTKRRASRGSEPEGAGGQA